MKTGEWVFKIKDVAISKIFYDLGPSYRVRLQSTLLV